ncbi:MAG: class I SAM-dependent methyltransferase [Gammaproteobacteria bacterium]|nr:class I SAM-dependent methyltransferase [Gammaproteobacteria bacterium]
MACKRYVAILKELYGDGIDDGVAWLDVGCGHGEFMVALAKFCPASVEIVGSEPNIHKQASARGRGLNVRFVDLDQEDRKYDFISLLNVYSHLPDPPSFIAKLRALLKPNGGLLIETGDTADLSADEHYRPFSLPDHLSFASEKIVTDILQRLDFEVEAVRKYPYLRVDAVTFGRELLKFFLPGYDSRLTDILQARNRYPTTDMYIRARKK